MKLEISKKPKLDSPNNAKLIRHQKASLLSYHKKKNRLPHETLKKQQQVLKQEEKELKIKHKELKEENQHLNAEIERLRECGSSSPIQTKRDGKTFSEDLRLTIYELEECQVSAKNIPIVITAVLKHLAKRTIESLPDKTTINRIVKEMKQLSKHQIRETLKNEEHTTLKYDGTEKLTKHYAEMQISTKSHTLTTGISELPSGSESYSNAILENISSIDNTFCGSAQSENSNILCDIANTMTDRHIVNKKVNTILKSAKEQACEESDVHWNNFFCALHPLDSLAKSADKTLCDIEKDFLTDIDTLQPHTYKKRGQSGTQAVVQAVCRLCFKLPVSGK